MPTISEALAIARERHQVGNLQSAEKIYRIILQAEPEHAEARHLLGVIGLQTGQPRLALEQIRAAIAVAPRVAAYYDHLGLALNALGEIDEAVAAFAQAIEIDPAYADAYNNLAVARNAQGRLPDVVACCQRALELRPDYPEALCNLGIALRGLGQLEQAEASLRRALQINPQSAEIWNNLGAVLRECGRIDESIACCQQALQRKPDYAEACQNLGNAWKDWGRIPEAIACYQRALQLNPAATAAHSNLLYVLQYRAGISPAELAAAHAEFQRRHAAPLEAEWRPHDNLRDPQRRLRLGFVSGDFGHHPVSYYLIRVLENLDPLQCETVCYSDRISPPAVASRFQATTTVWREVMGWSDPRLAEQIRADGIDVLFDLAGHSAHNRLLVFARKPAPIQITWIGYEGTTGLKAMDYILADRHMIPEGAESYYCEKVLRMPEGYLCYDPPDVPPPGPLPALQRGYVSFGCFNNPAKITPEVVAVWARILHRVPAARLVLKYRGLDQEGPRRRLRELFAARGIEPGRLDLLGYSLYGDYLAHYQQIDVGLDPFPFSGGATTCESLWMGVPVITWPGATFAGRHGLSHLANIGLPEFVAGDADAYVEMAVALAGDLPRLAAVRAALRARMAASPLCDGPRFAAGFMALMRDVWRQNNPG